MLELFIMTFETRVCSAAHYQTAETNLYLSHKVSPSQTEHKYKIVLFVLVIFGSTQGTLHSSDNHVALLCRTVE